MGRNHEPVCLALTPRPISSKVGLALAIIGLSGSAIIFVEVQVLQSYPFHYGVYGSQALLPGLSNTEALELFGLLGLVGLVLAFYSGSSGTRKARLTRALGSALLVLGLIIAPIVYIETSLLWGEVLPGVHVWSGIQGGGGYPWGNEQVAGNTCLIPSSVSGDCLFLNYNELFWLALLAVVVGYVMRNR